LGAVFRRGRTPKDSLKEAEKGSQTKNLWRGEERANPEQFYPAHSLPNLGETGKGLSYRDRSRGPDWCSFSFTGPKKPSKNQVSRGKGGRGSCPSANGGAKKLGKADPMSI